MCIRDRYQRRVRGYRSSAWHTCFGSLEAAAPSAASATAVRPPSTAAQASSSTQNGAKCSSQFPPSKARMLALHEADSVQWSLANLASRYGVKIERVQAMITLQRKEEAARQDGSVTGERADKSLWDNIELSGKPGPSQPTQETIKVGTRSNRYQCVPEGVSKEEVLAVLTGVKAAAPSQAAPSIKRADALVEENLNGVARQGTASRFEFVFRDAADELPFVVRAKDGSAQTLEVPVPAPKVFRRKSA
eukprot:TRINITY_DN7041_c0_g2_i2.p1 TRINITY_DN7041_c0_g2~~TRINITY_DN7041_c0_g2_i2.p1  ORF type:complete len:248 (+),score=58.99 TRINITY_DN7041_c0_g2_i2:88-831(+)